MNPQKWDRCFQAKPESWLELGLALIFGVLLGLLVIGGWIAFVSWIVMLLWNWLMPDLFGLGKIAFWQAFGLLLLCRLLIKARASVSGTPSTTKSETYIRFRGR